MTVATVRKASTLASELRKRIETTLTPRVDAGVRRICLIDPPGHPNVGDSAILLGELQYLRRTFPEASVTFFDLDNYSPGADAAISKADVLLFHGGGNFGDLWPHHQNFRNRILKSFPGKPAIQMAQSIHFSAAEKLAATARIIEAHKNLTLMVRDRKSLLRAQESFACEVVLCPDMAFAMEPISGSEPAVDCFYLLRTDKEVAAKHDLLLDTLRAHAGTLDGGDWLQEKPISWAAMDKALRSLVRRLPGGSGGLAGLTMSVRERYARERLAVGIAMLSSGRVVVTDRLHAHILSCLLGIPNAVFDSMDGKISAFHATWLARDETSQLCSSPRDLASFLAEHRPLH